MLQVFHLEVKSGKRSYYLIPFDKMNEVLPFKLQREYFIYNKQSADSGQHAHHEEEEVFFVIAGSMEFISIDEYGKRYSIMMKIGDLIYVPNKLWHGFHFNKNTAVVAFSSIMDHKNRDDYMIDEEAYLTQYQSIITERLQLAEQFYKNLPVKYKKI